MPASNKQHPNSFRNRLRHLHLRHWLPLPALLLLAACGSPPEQPQQPSSETSVGQIKKLDAEELMLLAEESDFDQAQIYRLRAAEILAQDSRPEASLKLLAKIHAYRLPFDLQKRFVLLTARLSTEQDDGWQALIALNNTGNLIYDRLNPDEQILLTEYRARAYSMLDYHEASAREYLTLARQQTGAPAQEARGYLWQSLLSLALSDIRTLLDQETDLEMQGWLDLARVRKEAANNLDQFTQELERWQSRWSAHPAANTLPEDLAFLMDISRNPIRNIAVFLPQSGPLARAGNAIRDGIISASLSARAENADTPDIRFYDSHSQPLDQLYRNARNDGAAVVIGPLSKNKVTQLQKRARLPLPTLALNYGTRLTNNNSQLFQYALSVEDEAQQAARAGRRDGNKRALTLTPASDWGGRALSAFEAEWKTQDGRIAESAMYSAKTNLGLSIEKMLEVDKSEQRWRQLSRLMDRRIEFEPRRRQDVDMLFLVATPATARQVKPALAFYYAGDLPVYATSHLYNGKPDTERDQDLNGIYFCDIPWFLEEDSGLKRTIDQAWPAETNRYGRLFAMGTDALQLAGRLRMLEALPNSKVYGATGALSLNTKRMIQRRLEWAVFDEGRPVLRQHRDQPKS